MNVFETLNSINVNGHTEGKPADKKSGKTLTYLSWAWAWAELMKVYPDAEYEIVKWDGRPYFYDDDLGYMVMTRLTIEGKTKEMWLPVMDSSNNAMKNKPYTFTKYGKYETTVDAASMMDINKTIMRCLVKNIGMFGLGLYIYAGEDLPEVETPEPKVEPKVEPAKPAPKMETKSVDPDALITKVQAGALLKRINGDSKILDVILTSYKANTLNDLKIRELDQLNRNWEKLVECAHREATA